MTTSNQVSAATIERALKRVRKLGDRELLDWADAAIPGMQRHLDFYRRSDEDAHLMELAFAEMQLNIVVTEMIERHKARREEGLTPD